MVPGDRAGDHGAAGHPGRFWSSPEVADRRDRWGPRARDDPQRAVVQRAAGRRDRRPPGYGRIRYDPGVRRQLLRDRRPSTTTRLPFDRSAPRPEILAAGKRDDRPRSTPAAEPVHPLDDGIRGVHHVQFVAARLGREALPARDGHPPRLLYDRSPCGTGHQRPGWRSSTARGELGLDTDFVNESFIGTHFVGRLVEETEVAGCPAVVPTITGRAWITGTAQYFLDPTRSVPLLGSSCERAVRFNIETPGPGSWRRPAADAGAAGRGTSE